MKANLLPRAAALAAALLASTSNVRAQAAHPAAAVAGDPHASAPEVRAVRTARAPRVDGRPDEPEWSAAVPATAFTQLDPREGEPASERTDARVLYDDEALYVAARLHDSSGRVSRRLARRDASLSDSDWFVVALDTYHDHLTVFRFQVNPSGVKQDEVATGDGSGDRSWDPVWEARTVVTDSGWTVEMRIPFSQLRFPMQDRQVWGIQLSRIISRNQETAHLAFTPKAERGGPTRYGHLVGLQGLRPGRRLEFMPYAVARGEYLEVPLRREGVDFRNPFRDGSDLFGGAGLDLKFRPTSNLTLDAAINPDFGQVEVDPAVVNLTAYETFYTEKRPFFVEGANLFSFGAGSQLFYSRRIGRPPQGGSGAGAVFSDVPTATTILGAAKLTGKTSRGLSVGFVEALTGREEARWLDAEGTRHAALAEPLANYFVGRVKQDLRGGRTVLGAMGTAVHRDLETDAMRGLLRSSAYAGGVDFSHEWAQRSWRLSGFATGSWVTGSRDVMAAAQRSSTRYYQRPDAEHLQVDSSATSLGGLEAGLILSKQAGLHWRGGVSLSTTSPGFEVNDLGFQSYADRVGAQLFATYQETRPGRVVRNWYVNPGLRLERNYAGDLLVAMPYVQMEARRLDYWTGNLYLSHTFGALDDRLTRGGPLARSQANSYVSAFVRSDPRRRVTFFASGSARRGTAGDRAYSLSAQVGLKPSTSWSATVGPRWTGGRVTAQYVTSVADSTAQGTFGRRYVFAELDQATLSLDARLNVTFSPTLSLELFAQPFMSGGDYGQLKELDAPRTFAFLRYGVDGGTVAYDSAARSYRVDPDGEAGPGRAFSVSDRDFDLYSLRGNAVLRWEWRAGSTLYLVWQQRRSEQVAGSGPFEASRVFQVRPDNVFLVKMTYWFNP
jgi:hypothetical protein